MQQGVLLVFSYVEVFKEVFLDKSLLTDPVVKCLLFIVRVRIYGKSVCISFSTYKWGWSLPRQRTLFVKHSKSERSTFKSYSCTYFPYFQLRWGSMYLCRSLLKTQKPDEKFFQTPPTLQNQLRFPTSTYLQKEHVIVRKDRRVPCERWSVRNLNHIHICRKKASCLKEMQKGKLSSSGGAHDFQWKMLTEGQQERLLFNCFSIFLHPTTMPSKYLQ